MINKLRITKIFYLFEAVDFYFDFLFNFIFVKKIEVCIFINLVNREAVKTADNIGRFWYENIEIPYMGNHVERSWYFMRKCIIKVCESKLKSNDSVSWETVTGSGTENWMKVLNSGSEDELKIVYCALMRETAKGKRREGREISV